MSNETILRVAIKILSYYHFNYQHSLIKGREMGNLMGCIEEVPDLQRLEYDMTPLNTNSIPIIWLVGPTGSGRSVQAGILSERAGFQVVDLRELIKAEGKKETDRGKLIKDFEKSSKKVPDFIIVDLVKEAMLEKVNDSKKGYIIVDFPRSSKQASLFVKEVGHVDFIIYLYATTDILIKRIMERPGPEETEKFLKETQNKLKEIREALNKYNYKIEKIYTDGEPAEVSANIQAMLIERLKSKAEGSVSLDTKTTNGSAHTSPFTPKKVTSN